MTIGLFGNHWVGGSLEGVMCVPLHMLVVLLAQCTGHFSCSLHFLGSPPLSPHLFSSFFIVLFIIYLVSSPLFFQFSVTGAGAGAGVGFFWLAGLLAGLQVEQAL